MQGCVFIVLLLMGARGCKKTADPSWVAAGDSVLVLLNDASGFREHLAGGVDLGVASTIRPAVGVTIEKVAPRFGAIWSRL